MTGSGRARILAGAHLKRSPRLPSALTLAEAGIVGFERGSQGKPFVPIGTPARTLEQVQGQDLNGVRRVHAFGQRARP